MLHDLRETATSISMEAASGLEAADRAAERIPTFLESAAEYLNRNVFQPLSNAFATRDLNWVANELQRKQYSEMRPIKISAPEKFSGTFVDYGNVLLAASEDMDALHDKVLVPLDSWVNGRLGDPNSLKSLTNTLKVPGLQDLHVDTLNKRLDKFFPDKSTVNGSRAPIYGEVIVRQADWKTIADIVRKLNTVYANGNYEKVCKKQSELTYSLRLLAKRIGEAPEEYKLSSVTTEQLSKVVIGVAEQIEFYGVLRSRVDEYLRAISDNQVLMSHYLKGLRVSMEGLFDVFKSKPASNGGKTVLNMTAEERQNVQFKSGSIPLDVRFASVLHGLENKSNRARVIEETLKKTRRLSNEMFMAGKTHTAKLNKAIREVSAIHDEDAFIKACDQKILPIWKSLYVANTHFKNGPLGLVGDAVFDISRGGEKPWYSVVVPGKTITSMPAITSVEELEEVLELREKLEAAYDEWSDGDFNMDAPDYRSDKAARDVWVRLKDASAQGELQVDEYQTLTYRGSEASRPEEYLTDLYTYVRAVGQALTEWANASIK